jgi:N-acetylneuraminic acid mutarotase
MEAEPSSRWAHYSAVVEDKLHLWGGRTKDFPEGPASSIHTFDPLLEVWNVRKSIGVPPPWLYDGASAAVGHHFYVCCGFDGSSLQSALYQLDTKLGIWEQLSKDGPMMRKTGCEMISYDGKLLLFGGQGYPTGPAQPGAEFATDTTDFGWSNKIHVYDLKEGKGVINS